MLDRIVLIGAGRTVESLLPKLGAIAPITVIDKSEDALAAMRREPSSAGGTASREDALEGAAITYRVADGTSRLVLAELRGAADTKAALVAATGEDRQNLEACRLAVDLGFGPVIGIAIDGATEAQYLELGVRCVVRATLLGQVVEQALRYDGLAMATTVGQGRGEIVEFVVLGGSPAIGTRLANLHADGWRIAAIYRDGTLVIPTGATVIEPEDRVLLVGEPELLPLVAEELRVGKPLFPMRDGRVVVLYGQVTPEQEREAERITSATFATSMTRLTSGATAERRALDAAPASAATGSRPKMVTTTTLTGDGLPGHLKQIRALRAGVLATPPLQRTLWEAVTGRGGRAAAIANGASCPVLFVRGTARYTRVVYAVLEAALDDRIALDAIDLARLLDVPLCIVRVALPAYLESPPPELARLVAELERRVHLYGIPAETLSLTGNPIAAVLAKLTPTDLLVAGRRRGGTDSFSSPDVALRFVRADICSVLVRTLDGRPVSRPERPSA